RASLRTATIVCSRADVLRELVHSRLRWATFEREHFGENGIRLHCRYGTGGALRVERPCADPEHCRDARHPVAFPGADPSAAEERGHRCPYAGGIGRLSIGSRPARDLAGRSHARHGGPRRGPTVQREHRNTDLRNAARRLARGCADRARVARRRHVRRAARARPWSGKEHVLHLRPSGSGPWHESNAAPIRGLPQQTVGRPQANGELPKPLPPARKPVSAASAVGRSAQRRPATDSNHKRSPPAFPLPLLATAMTTYSLTHLKQLEAESIHIIREVAAEFKNPVMLYSIGKDSSVMVQLALKAFYPAKPPFPLMHVDTTWKFRDMIEFRENYARKELGLEVLVYINEEGRRLGIDPFENSGKHTTLMKTEALKQALNKYGFDAAFGGARRDEE